MKTLLLLLAVGLSQAAYPEPASQTCDTACQEAQLQALTALYESTNGSNWLRPANYFTNGTAIAATQWGSALYGPISYCYWAGKPLAWQHS